MLEPVFWDTFRGRWVCLWGLEGGEERLKQRERKAGHHAFPLPKLTAHPSSWARGFHKENRKEAIGFHAPLGQQKLCRRKLERKSNMFYALWLKVRPWVRSGIQGGAEDGQRAGSLGWYKRMGIYWS